MTENNYDEFTPLLGIIARIDTERHKLPIFGKIISLSPQFLTIERKDGRLTLIKRKAILAIEPVKEQHPNQIAGVVQ
jgi:hypothetical protein